MATGLRLLRRSLELRQHVLVLVGRREVIRRFDALVVVVLSSKKAFAHLGSDALPVRRLGGLPLVCIQRGD